MENLVAGFIQKSEVCFEEWIQEKKLNFEEIMTKFVETRDGCFKANETIMRNQQLLFIRLKTKLEKFLV